MHKENTQQGIVASVFTQPQTFSPETPTPLCPSLLCKGYVHRAQSNLNCIRQMLRWAPAKALSCLEGFFCTDFQRSQLQQPVFWMIFLERCQSTDQLLTQNCAIKINSPGIHTHMPQEEPRALSAKIWKTLRQRMPAVSFAHSPLLSLLIES